MEAISMQLRFNTARSVRTTILVCFTALILSLLSFAQTSKGILAGTVPDTTGAIVVGATVNAKNVQTGAERSATTGPTGGYRMDAVEPGAYKITVTSSGFKTTTIDNVDVKASVVTSVNANLAVGTVTDVVEISSGTT